MGIDVIAPEGARAATAWAIGEPGRAAVEVTGGRPTQPSGLADVELTSASLGSMVAVAATVRGLLHRTLDEPRQDAYALSSIASPSGEESLIAVVCDGVGSLAQSHEAAQLVSRTLATEAAEGRAWPEAFAHANQQLQVLMEEASDRGDGANGGGMATTAVALVARRDGDEWVGDLAWVGDSSCWHLQDDGCWRRLGPPMEGDDESGYYTGSVTPLPSEDGACECKTFRVESGSLFLMSDGVANPLAWIPEVQDVLAEWWRVPPDALTFAGQVGFARKTHIDDRTAVGIWHQPKVEEVSGEDPEV